MHPPHYDLLANEAMKLTGDLRRAAATPPLLWDSPAACRWR
jgi:hypothetical protein